MITREYLKGLGLTEDQISAISSMMEKQIRFIKLLELERVNRISAVLRITDITELDFRNEDLLREKIRLEFSDMIPRKTNNVQIWGIRK